MQGACFGRARQEGLLGNHHSRLFASLAHVPKERGVRTVAGADDLEVGFGRASAEEQHRRVRVASSRRPDHAFDILELIVNCFCPKRGGRVMHRWAPDKSGGDSPLEKCRSAQACQSQVPAKLQYGVLAGFDAASWNGLPSRLEWDVVEQRLENRRLQGRGSAERRNTLAALILNRSETRRPALTGVEGVAGKSEGVHAMHHRATGEHGYVRLR